MQRDESIAVIALVAGILGAIAAWMVVPEFRSFAGLGADSTAEKPGAHINSNPAEASVHKKEHIARADVTTTDAKKDFKIEDISLNPESCYHHSGNKPVAIPAGADPLSYFASMEFVKHDHLLGRVECVLRVENTFDGEEVQIDLNTEKIVAIDLGGVEHTAEEVSLGSRELVGGGEIGAVLIPHAPIQLRLLFNKQREKTSGYSVLRLPIGTPALGYRNVELRNIQIRED